MRDRHLPSVGSLPERPQQIELDKAEARRREFHPGLPQGWQRPEYLGHLLHQQDARAEVDLKWTPIWDAGVPSGNLAHGATVPAPILWKIGNRFQKCSPVVNSLYINGFMLLPNFNIYKYKDLLYSNA